MWHAFQAVVDLRSGGTVGFEALARFPGRGPQAVLKELAAQGDAAQRAFDEESVRLAVASAREWLPRGARLFVNLTAATLAAVVAGVPLPDAGGLSVVFELAENAATQAVLSEHGAWEALARHGAVWALDDVGDGRADLARLSAAVAHGVRWVKIARQAVAGAARDPARLAVLRSVSTLGASVIAEGVEDPADLEAMSSAGIGFVQGFAVGRPEPRPDLRPALALAGAR
jgi:EAL domain-containing protein (putative c-di-GMP-specific phosphodiesterase class I)